MPLLTLENIGLNFGPQIILDNASLTLHRGQHIGLLGRNGAGKSTFLKLISGEVQADSGEYWLRPGTKIASLSQDLPETSNITVRDFVASGMAEVTALLDEYDRLSANAMDNASLKKLEHIQHEIEARDGWNLQQHVDTIISHLALPEHKTMAELSGGWRRRVALGRALLSQPDILLLDEPTNHLDIPAIQWLENFLRNYGGTVILITHDRAFLQQVATKIIELDRGYLRVWDGDYQGFLDFQAEQLAAEETANALFDKRLAEEEKWIRQGIKARRTRNEGRVRALKALREEAAARRNRQGSADFGIEQAGLSGKIVMEAKGIYHRFDKNDAWLINNFSTLVMRGDKVGFIGVNGCGKSTLLKILLGELSPEQGNVKLGTKMEVAYFDQLRSQLDEKKSVIDNLSEGREFIEINGKNRHIISYLQDFLFLPERVRQPVSALSGGEQNRLILAKLFSKPANVLVLDEPTNDLDMETLELLEDILMEFTGTVLLVSHDRAFIDNVVTRSIVFEGAGKINEVVGGYSDWVTKGGRLIAEPEEKASPTAVHVATPKATSTKKKLSYKEQRELDQLPQQIDMLEQQITAFETRISEPSFYTGNQAEIDSTLKSLSEVQQQLDDLYLRWEELDSD